MSVTIGSTRFEHVDYDEEADVLYLHVGDPSTAVDFDESPEGHGLRFDSTGALVGVTVIGPRRLVQEGRALEITVPSHLEIEPAELEALLAQA